MRLSTVIEILWAADLTTARVMVATRWETPISVRSFGQTKSLFNAFPFIHSRKHLFGIFTKMPRSFGDRLEMTAVNSDRLTRSCNPARNAYRIFD